MVLVGAVSHSFLDTAQRCEKKLEYRYVRGYSKRVVGVKPERGTWVHELLAAYYQALQKGQSQSQALQAAAERHTQYKEEFWDRLFEEEQEELGEDLPEQVLSIFNRYIDRYTEADKRWKKILLVERYLKIPVSWLPVPLGIKCDLVTLDEHGFVWVIDHKVVSSIPEEEERMLDTQGARYILGLQELFKLKKIKVRGIGVIYDYIRDRIPAKPQPLKSGKGLSKAWIDTDYDTYMAAIKEHGFDPNDYQDILTRISTESRPYFERWPMPKSDERLHQEKLNIQAIVKRHLEPKDFYPRTLDRTRCRWDCEYKQLCLIELEGGDIDHLLKTEYEVRKEGDHAVA